MNGSLVTGAGGFIGRRLAARLCADGEWVRALLLPGEPSPEASELWRGDVTRPASLAGAMRGMRTVFHLAAVVGDWGPEALFQAVNVDGTRHVLDEAARAGVERVVVVSSLVVYGSQLRDQVCDEDRPTERGVGPYGRSKRAQEEVALAAHRAGRVPVTVVRPGNVVGPGSRNWVDTPVELLRGRRVVLIDGGEGDAAFTWVDNLVDLLVLAARAPDAAGRIYNGNDGSGVTWRRYLTDLARLAGAPRPLLSVPAAAAMTAAAAMETAWRATRRRSRPLLTREAVALLAARHPVPIARAARELAFRPAIEYPQALDRLAECLHSGGQP